MRRNKIGRSVDYQKIPTGGVPPDGFTQPTQILTESGTWTVPRSGTYRVTCIGSGGKSYSFATEEAGGGAGGIAESQLKLSKGLKIDVTVDDAVSSFGAYLSAMVGQNGFNDNNSLKAGAGGAGTGGNIGNYIGGDGTVLYPPQLGSLNSKLGGDTSNLSHYGQSYGNKLFYISGHAGVGQYWCCEIEYTPFRLDMKYPFGGGGGAMSPENSFNHLPGSNNGAIIIEYLK